MALIYPEVAGRLDAASGLFLVRGQPGSGEARCHTRGREGGSDITSRSERGLRVVFGPDWD